MLKKYFLVFLISMVPLIELRGAIPYSQAFGMPLWSSYVVAIVGNMLPVPFIYLFARKVLIWAAERRRGALVRERSIPEDPGTDQGQLLHRRFQSDRRDQSAGTAWKWHHRQRLCK